MLLRHVKGALDNRFSFSGQGMARLVPAQYTVWTVDFDPTLLGYPRPIPTVWQRRLGRPHLPGRTIVSDEKANRRCLSKQCLWDARKIYGPTRKGDVAR